MVSFKWAQDLNIRHVVSICPSVPLKFINSATNHGKLCQVSLFYIDQLETATSRKIYIITLDILEEYSEKPLEPKEIIIIGVKNKKIEYLRWCGVRESKQFMDEALELETGDLQEYLDGNQRIKLPKHIVSQVLMNVWSYV